LSVGIMRIESASKLRFRPLNDPNQEESCSLLSKKVKKKKAKAEILRKKPRPYSWNDREEKAEQMLVANDDSIERDNSTINVILYNLGRNAYSPAMLSSTNR
jgi:hypothetical protein